MPPEIIESVTSFFKELSPISAAITSNVLVVGVFGWLAQKWAEKRIETIKFANTTELEKTKSELAGIRDEFKANLDKRMMVFQTHFELEFGHLRRLWEICDEALDYAAQIPRLYEVSWIDEETMISEKERAVEMYDACVSRLGDARRMRPFIPRQVADLSKEMMRLCVIVTQEYMHVYDAMHEDHEDGEYWDRNPARLKATRDIEEARAIYEQTSDLISERISSLYALAPN
jgi:hypothetical protein